MADNLPDLPFHNVNEVDFIHTLNSSIAQRLSLNELEQLTYVTNVNYKHSVDDSLSQNLFREPKCHYYFCGDIIEKQKSSHNLNILSFNINSVPLHFDELRDQCLSQYNLEFQVIGLCETRLNDSICSLYRLEGYNAHFKNKNTSGGGLALFLRKMYTAKTLPEINLQLCYIETMFLEVVQPYNFVIGIVYRPPNSNFDDFLVSLENILLTLARKKMPCYLFGDFNVNMLAINGRVQNFTDLFYSNMYYPTINKPTRITNVSATLIDHIWTNDLNYYSSGILYTSVSDHFPVFSSFSPPIIKSNSAKVVFKKRIINNTNIEAFSSELSNYTLDDLPHELELNEAYDKFIDKFTYFYNKHFPIEEYSIKEKHSNKPYITQGIRKSIKERNRLQRLYAKWPLTYENAFKKYRNTLTSIIRSAKSNYHKSKLAENSGNAKKTWEVVNDIMGKNIHQLPDSITFDNKITSNRQEIAELFNNFFCNVASTLHQAMPPASTSFQTYLPERAAVSFFITPTTTQEIESVIQGLKVTSPGHDKIDVRVVKRCCTIISPFLEYVINRSFNEGIFPKSLQISHVIPIFKKGDKSSYSNYRPISLLPCFSKIFEKLMVKRLMDYLTNNSLLCEHQYGFRPKYNTELAVQQLCQHIYDAIDNKLYQLTIFCDLTKAFDTLSHPILLDKLNNYGISGTANNWFKSYLSHRQQYTDFKNTTSSYCNISYGVPQGSILGPLLFLIYVNDLTNASKKFDYLLYADDTTLFITGNNITEIKNVANEEMVHIANWFKSNKLTLNINKTFFMVSHSIMSITPQIDLNFNGFSLKQVNEIKFLGITIDNTLKWRSHINEIRTKLSKIIGVTYKIRDYLNTDNLKQIYFSLAYPHLLYCCAVWGGACKTFIESLFVSQKKMMRAMYFQQRFDHTNHLFRDNNLLKLIDIIELQTILFVHSAINLFPLDCNFQFISRNNRTRQNLRIPLCRTNHSQQSILVRGARSWNNLPNNVKIDISRNSLKKIVKQNLLSKYN